MSLESIAEDRKLMPSNYPEIDWGKRWKTEFNKLEATGLYSQTEIIKKIAKEHNISYPTVYIQIFSDYRLKQKSSPSRKYENRIEQPSFSRKRLNEESARRGKVRYHIDKYISLAFHMSGHQSLELPQLSDLINEMTDVRFKPSSFLTLNENYQKQTGESLIERYKCHLLPRYGL